MASVEDDIVEDLQKIGITVNTIKLDSEAYSETEKNGDYHLLFARTWGAPYDPHSYLESWQVPSHVEYSAIGGLEAPLTRDELLGKIEAVQGELDVEAREAQWHEILQDIHKQAIFLPLWGSRVPYTMNRRFTGFTPSNQAYTYPINNVRILSGSRNVTVAAGSGGGTLLENVGPLNPHQYSPNQLFAQAWVYEGLLSYGQDGAIEPGLAESWDEIYLEEGGQRVTFQLRQGVKFHDGTDFNCAAVKLNFDHVLHEVVRERHSWHGTPQVLSNWFCNGDFEFVVETSKAYYPLLQELTYIRPLTIAAPSAFVNGLDSDPATENSCLAGGFGGVKWDHIEEAITCGGLSAPIGTGPFKFIGSEPLTDDIDHTITFQGHADYWGGAPEIDYVHLKYFENTDQVYDAMLDGSLDMTLGSGPLTSPQIRELHLKHSAQVKVSHTDVIQHTFVIFNTGRVPTNDIETRRAIIHAIDKNRFIQEELAGLEQPVEQLLPETAPYCSIDLTPKWSFDLNKATLLNCPAGLSVAAKSGIGAAVVLALGLAAFVCCLIRREKAGKPMFAPPKDVELVSA